MEDMENLDNQDFKMPKQLFVDSCNEAFVVLNQAKKEKMGVSDIGGAQLAIRRMLGLFIDQEEYEKCIFLKKFLDENFKGNNDPLFDYRKL
jgi:hypothetical protein